jgi:hypothetical protein
LAKKIKKNKEKIDLKYTQEGIHHSHKPAGQAEGKQIDREERVDKKAEGAE